MICAKDTEIRSYNSCPRIIQPTTGGEVGGGSGYLKAKVSTLRGFTGTVKEAGGPGSMTKWKKKYLT